MLVAAPRARRPALVAVKLCDSPHRVVIQNVRSWPALEQLLVLLLNVDEHSVNHGGNQGQFAECCHCGFWCDEPEVAGPAHFVVAVRIAEE